MSITIPIPNSPNASGSPPERRPRFLHRRRDREGAGLRALRADHPLRAAPRARGRGGARRRARARRRAPPRARRRPAADRRLVAHLGRAGAARSRPRRRRAFRRPTCRRGTRFSCRSRSAGPRSLGAHDIVIGVNALDYSGYPDCRPEFIARVRAPRQPGDARRRRGRPLPRAHAAHRAQQGRHHPARAGARARLRPHAQLLRSRRRRTAVRHAATAACCAPRDSAKPASPTRCSWARIARTPCASSRASPSGARSSAITGALLVPFVIAADLDGEPDAHRACRASCASRRDRSRPPPARTSIST